MTREATTVLRLGFVLVGLLCGFGVENVRGQAPEQGEAGENAKPAEAGEQIGLVVQPNIADKEPEALIRPPLNGKNLLGDRIENAPSSAPQHSARVRQFEAIVKETLFLNQGIGRVRLGAAGKSQALPTEVRRNTRTWRRTSLRHAGSGRNVK